jgi:hypothetical protein
MLNQMTERECVICKSAFMTHKEKQIYCSYDCYRESCKIKGKEYYQKLRSVGLVSISKICPVCHEEFSTTSLRKLYCNHECYHNACLEKNREFMQKKRLEWQIKNPVKTTCTMCSKEIIYKSRKPKYCEDCRLLARRIKRQWGEVEMPE